MTTIHLNEYWTKRLAQVSESGMGYQRVDIILKNQRVLRNVLVYNAEECQTHEEFDVADIADILLHST